MNLLNSKKNKRGLHIRIIGGLLYPILFFSIFSCGPPEPESIVDQEPHRLKMVTPSGPGVKAIYEIATNFSRNHQGVNVEISAISGTIPINAFLSSKFAVGDEPDIMIYQAGQSTRLFAQGDHLLDLSGLNFEERFILGADRYCRYRGRLYALPLDIYVSGLLIQMSVLWKASIGNQDNRAIPRTLDEFIASCERLRRAGFQYPVLVDASSEMGASYFLYQYIHQNVYETNPAFYTELLDKKKQWTDREFAEAYEAYERIRPYVSPDAMYIDRDQAVRRFALKEAAYLIGDSGYLSRIRKIVSELDMILVPPPWKDDPSKVKPIQGVDTVISASSVTPYPEEVIAFLREFVSTRGADLYSGAVGSISSMRDSAFRYDCSLGPENDVFKSGLTEFVAREWLPDFNIAFKKLNREWLGGRSSSSILEELEIIHRRLVMEMGI